MEAERHPVQTAAASETWHATCVSVEGRGVLLLGSSGAGKSDLALRLIHGTFRVGGRTIAPELVADDRVCVEVRSARIGQDDGRLVARAPATLAGLIEVRGLGILEFPSETEAELCLAVELVKSGDPERLPDPAPVAIILGRKLPLIHISPFEASAPLKVVLALLQTGRAQLP